MDSTKKLDRRIVRTRAMLQAALLDLIDKQGYDSISVADITDRADLRRATFYLHYKDKGDLLLATLESMFDQLVAQIEAVTVRDPLAGKTDLATWRAMFEHVAAHRTLYKNILTGASAAAIGRRIRAYLAERLLMSLRAAPPESISLPAEVIANYLAGAEVGLMIWWLESDAPYSAEDMAAMAQRLALDGARGVVSF